MKFNFIPLDYDTVSLAGQTYVRIFGKTEDGKSCCIVDEAVNFFYVFAERPDRLLEKIKKIGWVKKAEIIGKSFLEKPVKAIRVYCEYNRMDDVAHGIKDLDQETQTKERDINQITRYIIEKKIKPLIWQEVEGSLIANSELGGLTNSLDVALTIKLEKVKEVEKQPEFKPKVLAFDIETDEFEIGRGKILMLSLVSDGFKKVLTWKKAKGAKSYVEFVNGEAELIQKFSDYIQELKPDIITGYFSDGFDLPYLRNRAEKNGIDLRLGVANAKVLFSKGRPINATIKGLVHIDLLKFIETVYSQYMQSETLRLHEVAKEFLGEGKLEHEHKRTEEMKEEDWHNFFEYNLQDSLLTYKLFQKLWPDMLEFTKIVQEPLFITTRHSMSGLVESYIIHNLERFNEVAERRPIYEEIEKRKTRGKYEGAFVLQPEAALYENLAIFDFTSMYASIIVSFNLSRSTFLEGKGPNALEVDIGKKVYFSKKKGFMPSLLEEIVKLRRKYKQELSKKPDAIKKARSNAFKLLANATYGYNGFFGARYYCLEAAASTAALARKFIKDMIDKTNKADYKVIYADTDGFAFLLGKKTKQETLSFLEKLNSQLPGIMELELEDFFKRGIWVTKRTGEFGAKKKYALINHQGKIKIRGFETVRRDWRSLVRVMQSKVLEMILGSGTHESALKYVREVVKKLKKRKIDKKELIIKTQLRKPLSEYKAEGPHVAIAKRMQKEGIPVNVGMLIEYYVAEGEKKARVRDKAKLPDEKGDYDIEYYTKHQILPAVENIFEVFSISEEDILQAGQKKLEQFFG